MIGGSGLKGSGFRGQGSVGSGQGFKKYLVHSYQFTVFYIPFIIQGSLFFLNFQFLIHHLFVGILNPGP
jgi:hypothetical protein